MKGIIEKPLATCKGLFNLAEYSLGIFYLSIKLMQSDTNAICNDELLST